MSVNDRIPEEETVIGASPSTNRLLLPSSGNQLPMMEEQHSAVTGDTLAAPVTVCNISISIILALAFNAFLFNFVSNE